MKKLRFEDAQHNEEKKEERQREPSLSDDYEFVSPAPLPKGKKARRELP